jgi:hypothetical protein
MTTLVLIALIAFAGIAFLVWIIDSANRQKSEADRQREQKKLEAKLRTEEAIRNVRETAPELAPLRNAVASLRDFVACANEYRPAFAIPSDKFREVRFLFLLMSSFLEIVKAPAMGLIRSPGRLRLITCLFLRRIDSV